MSHVLVHLIPDTCPRLLLHESKISIRNHVLCVDLYKKERGEEKSLLLKADINVKFSTHELSLPWYAPIILALGSLWLQNPLRPGDCVQKQTKHYKAKKEKEHTRTGPPAPASPSQAASSLRTSPSASMDMSWLWSSRSQWFLWFYVKNPSLLL